MSTIKVLSKLDTEKILKNLSLNDIINTSLSAFHAHSNNLTESPHRIGLSCEKFTSLFMPSDVKGLGTTCKIVSIPKVGAKGLASSTIVFDEEGSVQWLVNSELLTAVRTAAGKYYYSNVLYYHF
jgi:ornithine cyclodeaminase/alanine dehydrogenase-like protein (mu-crystallin family)